MRKRLFMIPSLIAAGLFPQKASALAPGAFVDKKDPKPTLLELFRLQHKYTLAGHRSHSSHSSHSSHRSSSGGGYSAPSYSSPSPTYNAPVYSEPAPLYSSPPAPKPSYSAPAAAPLPEPEVAWILNSANGQAAWLAKVEGGVVGPSRRFSVGDGVEGLGRITEIARKNGLWTVVSTGRTIAQDASAAAGTSSARPNPPSLPGNSDKFKRIVMQVQTALAAYGYYSGTIDGRVGPSTRTSLSSMQSDYGLKVTGTVTPQTLDALRIVAE